MPRVTFTQENMPQTEEEFLDALHQAEKESSPVDDLVQLTQELTRLEVRHGLDSEEFYERFQRGEMGDDMEFIRWANKYEFYRGLRAKMERTFDLLEQYALPAPVS